MLISITHPQAFSGDLTLMGFDDAEFLLLYLARKMDSNDRYLPAARALVERCGATGTTASRLSPGVTARDIGARSSHREVKVGPLSPQHRRVHPHYGPLPRALPLCLPPRDACMLTLATIATIALLAPGILRTHGGILRPVHSVHVTGTAQHQYFYRAKSH